MNNFMMSSAKRIVPTVGLLLYAAAIVRLRGQRPRMPLTSTGRPIRRGGGECRGCRRRARRGLGQSEVAVTGRAGAAVEKVELSGSGSHAACM